MSARILLFALDELRRRYGPRTPPGADPRTDTAAFRAFREELLGAAARLAREPAELSMWWEGTYNGYFLAVAVSPPDAVPGLAAAAGCPVDEDRDAARRRDGYPLARVAPGRSEVVRDGGAACEAPFGAPSGHFGAPGMRRVT